MSHSQAQPTLADVDEPQDLTDAAEVARYGLPRDELGDEREWEPWNLDPEGDTYRRSTIC